LGCDLVRDAAPHLAAPDGVVEAILPEISIGQDGSGSMASTTPSGAARCGAASRTRSHPNLRLTLRAGRAPAQPGRTKRRRSEGGSETSRTRNEPGRDGFASPHPNLRLTLRAVDGDANPSLPGSFLVREVSDPPSERDAAPHLAAPDGVVEAILPEISIGQDGGVEVPDVRR
jgi:hypothetical protein